MNVDVHLFIACRAPVIMPFSCVLVCICEHVMPKHSILCGPSQYFHFNTYVPSFLPSLAIFYFKSFSLPLQGGLLLNTVCNFSCTKNQIGKNISIVIIQYVLKQLFSYPWKSARLFNCDLGTTAQYRVSFLDQAEPICCAFIKQMPGIHRLSFQKKRTYIVGIVHLICPAWVVT